MGSGLSKRIDTAVALAAAAVGLLLVAGLGLWVYVSSTAEPLHPDPSRVDAADDPPAEGPWAAAAARGAEVARAALAEQNLPGLSVAVGAGGRVVWAAGFGWADLQERVPVTPGTRFRIGTLSIPLTSAAVGVLLEDQRLSLDDEIQAHVPEFPPKPWPVTVRQAMGHTAGLRTDGGDEGPLFGVHCDQLIEALAYFADRPLLFQPGTGFRASSYGWILVSAVVEAAAGEAFERFMRKRLFEPAGMDDTRPDDPDESPSTRATSYFPRFAAEPRYGPQLMRPIDLSCYGGASVFLSTPTDLVRFGLALGNGTLLDASTVLLLQTPQTLISGEDTGYGLGWMLEPVTVAGTRTAAVGYDGALLGGRVGTLLALPASDLVVAVLSNTSYADTRIVALRLAEAFAAR